MRKCRGKEKLCQLLRFSWQVWKCISASQPPGSWRCFMVGCGEFTSPELHTHSRQKCHSPRPHRQGEKQIFYFFFKSHFDGPAESTLCLFRFCDNHLTDGKYRNWFFFSRFFLGLVNVKQYKLCVKLLFLQKKKKK